MSFTSIVKNEVSKLETNELEKIAELSAIISNGAIIDKEIKITTENASIARRIYNLAKDLYQINPLITIRRISKKNLYILQIKNKEILKNLGIYEKKLLKIPKEYIIDDEESVRAYLRGVFLMAGSLNDPKTARYHLEFTVDSRNYALFIKQLLNRYQLNSKVIKRGNKYMIYIKEAEKISDFLRIINAYNAVMYFEDIRIYRDHKNMTNRLNNCEQANVDKIIETANKQIKNIEIIKDNVGLDLLDEKERIVAEYRLKYKDISLLELSDIISIETGKKITKSGIYHRLKKIDDIANKIKNKLWENVKQNYFLFLLSTFYSIILMGEKNGTNF